MIALLTGPPGVGKSSTGNAIAQLHPSAVELVSFGKLIYEAVISRLGARFSYDEFRANAATLVGLGDISAATKSIVDRKEEAAHKWLLIDSHAVSQTSYGWQAFPDAAKTLNLFSYDKIIHLHAPSDIIWRRIQANPSGRHVSTVQKTQVLINMQMSISIYYAGIIGCPLEVVDASGAQADIVGAVEHILGLTFSST